MARPRNTDIALRLAVKEKAQNIEKYLNRLEEIFSNYSMAEQQTDKLAELSLITGKIMITFGDLCNLEGIYEE